MLRTATKEKLNSILELMLDLHKKGISEQEEPLPEVLNDCQQAAVSVGVRLEKELPERTDLVEKLEQYCEELYQLSVRVFEEGEAGNAAEDPGDQGSFCEESHSERNIYEESEYKKAVVESLDKLIKDVRDQLAQTPAVYQAIFMPYKAEMWDSLESIWMAFDKDENSEALVMPLPYSQFDAEAQTWNPCYEGDRFPEYVPITHYNDYHLEEEYPEFIFIHNPYDEYNLVTRIHPAYFSYELKKYTKTLVYVPYYLTSGFVSDEHKMLSAYASMDYMIAQSELFKDGMKDTPFYDKVIALGSPKLDRVIRMCEDYRKFKETAGEFDENISADKGDPWLPEEWKKVIGNKKCVMLNTSLGYFLRFTDRYLNKIRAVIDWLKENPVVALIWRPHPLFESTIRSIHPELLPMYQELVQYFLDSGIGVLDQTPDIARTIAIVDAYIGDGMTSVVNLFGAAGRPMFILDAMITRPSTEEEKRKFWIYGIAGEFGVNKKIDGRLWLTSPYYNGLFCMGEDWNQVQFVHRFEEQPHWNAAYSSMLIQGRTFCMGVANATKPICYQVDTGEEIDMNWEANGKNLGLGGAISYKDRLFYLSSNLETLGFYEYQKKDGSWAVYSDALRAFTAERPASSKEPCISGGYWDLEHSLWYTGIYTNRVLCFDMETHTHTFYQIGPEGYGYTGIRWVGNTLYLVEAHGTGKLMEVSLEKNTVQEYSIPMSGRVWRNQDGVECVVGSICDMGNYLVLCPVYSNRMWRFDKFTKEFVSLAEEFWEEASKEADNFVVEMHGMCNFIGIFEEQPMLLWAQRVKDGAILILDIETGEYEVRHMNLSEEAYTKLMEGEDGFQKGDIVAPFVQCESRLFSYDSFMRKVANGELEEVKKRQKEELVTLAANMDGTCGESVHDYFKNIC